MSIRLQKRIPLLLAISSGILLSLSLMLMLPIFPLIALTPLLIAIYQKSIKQTLFWGAITGIVLGMLTCFWMLESVAGFADGIWFAWLAYLATITTVAIVMALAALLLYPIINNKLPFYLKSVLIAIAWTLFEWVSTVWFSQTFWLYPYVLTAGLVKSPFLLQSVALGSSLFPSFFCAWINASLALLILECNKKTSLLLVSAIVCFVGISFLSKAMYNPPATSKEVSITLINTNHPLHLKWNDQTGNTVVKEMLRLNKEARRNGTALQIWTESIVPWTFRTDDDFLNELFKDSLNDNSGQIIGLLSDYSKDRLYNSAYYIESLQKPVKRYDKIYPVTFAEAPLEIFSHPLKNSFEFNVQAGSRPEVFDTKVGKAGVFICNESILGRFTSDLVKKGAAFFVIISNDGWVSNSSYMLNQHFYSARVRAIESRRPTIINSNLGYSGAFDALGNEISKTISTTGFTEKIIITVSYH